MFSQRALHVFMFFSASWQIGGGMPAVALGAAPLGTKLALAS
jgi:hypothetical protein